MKLKPAAICGALVAAMSLGAPAPSLAFGRGTQAAFAHGAVSSQRLFCFLQAPSLRPQAPAQPAPAHRTFPSGGASRFIGGRQAWAGVVVNQAPGAGGDSGAGNVSTIFESVGAAGSLRFKGTGFKEPEQKPAVDVAANFKVKPVTDRKDMENTWNPKEGKLKEVTPALPPHGWHTQPTRHATRLCSKLRRENTVCGE